jgi:cytochrome c peroxidase
MNSNKPANHAEPAGKNRMPISGATHSTAIGLPRWIIGVAVAACILLGTGSIHNWKPVQNQLDEGAAWSSAGSSEPILPIEPLRNLDPRKILLGRKLFHDARLSHNNRISCAGCHGLSTGGTDRKTRSIGVYGAVGDISSPTVLNAGFNFSQFWDGRAATLEKQIDGPVESKSEMGSNWVEVLAKLRDTPEYGPAFQEIYGGGIRRGDVENAIAEYERSLSTPNSRFDKYLRHEVKLTDAEKQGYGLFKSSGCASCHQGMNVGGNMYQTMGVMAPYFADRGHVSRADRGRFNVTGDPGDMYMFKVPSLRNVAITPPYFHDGSAATLLDAVRLMARYQLGHALTGSEVKLIVGFLNTLTGELDGRPL